MEFKVQLGSHILIEEIRILEKLFRTCAQVKHGAYYY